MRERAIGLFLRVPPGEHMGSARGGRRQDGTLSLLGSQQQRLCRLRWNGKKQTFDFLKT